MGSFCSIDAGYYNDLSSMVKNRKTRIEEWLNQKTTTDSLAQKSEKTDSTADTEKTPFDKLVKSIEDSDLSLAAKKEQIHYARYALMNMDTDQADEFVTSMKMLIRLKEMNESGNYDAVSGLFSNDLTAEIEETLDKLNDILETSGGEKQTDNSSESNLKSSVLALLQSSMVKVSESLSISWESDSSSVLERYVKNVNVKYESLVSVTSTAVSSSVDVVA